MAQEIKFSLNSGAYYIDACALLSQFTKAAVCPHSKYTDR